MGGRPVRATVERLAAGTFALLLATVLIHATDSLPTVGRAVLSVGPIWLSNVVTW